MTTIALVGFGNVGKSIYDIFKQNGDVISSRIGGKSHIKTICVRSVEKYKDQIDADTILTSDFNDILNDDSIDIVVEVIGGEYPAFDYISQALAAKKHVVTANKEVIGKHKQHFFELAKKNGVDIYFEAAVGGGIPIIRSLKVGFAANRINAFYGIVNGTTNYILTRIEEDKKDFSVILKQAQELGFAELDPTMDVSGLDAAYKCVILAAVAFKFDTQLESLYYEGIESITLKDIQYAIELGYRIKLLAIGKREESDTFQLAVYPCMIPLSHPLSTVRNEFNAVYVVGDQVGESMLLGKGAGGSPTASAVLSDIMDISFNLSHSGSSRNLETEFVSGEVATFEDTEHAFYLRFFIKDESGALEQVTSQFSEQSISIDRIIQKESEDGVAEVLIVTQSITETAFQTLLKSLEAVASFESLAAKIRLSKTL